MCRVRDLLSVQACRQYAYLGHFPDSFPVEDDLVEFIEPTKPFKAINPEMDHSHKIRLSDEARGCIIRDTSLLIDWIALREKYLADLELVEKNTLFIVRGQNKPYAAFLDEVQEVIAHYGYTYEDVSTGSFLLELDTLYLLYALWVKKYYGLSFLPHEAVRILSLDDEITLERAKSRIGDLRDDAVLFDLVMVDGIPVYQERYSNLLGIALLQMSDIIKQGVEGLDGRSVGECKECGAKFVKRHGKASLCENCRSNAVKLRNFRARERVKREAEKNAHQEK